MYIGLSSEVFQDAVSLNQSIGPMMRNSLAWAIDDAIINGNGVARPMGILSAPCAVKVTRSASNAVALSDLAKMFGRLPSNSMDKAVWLMSPSAFASLLSIETGGGQLILQSSPGATARTPMRLFGAEIRSTEKLPPLGSEGDVVLADLSYYAFGTRETGRFESTISASWTQDITDVRLIWRLDGLPLIGKSMVLSAGGNNLSPFVILQ
jgi:HK97 family phage major capsid protein